MGICILDAELGARPAPPAPGGHTGGQAGVAGTKVVYPCWRSRKGSAREALVERAVARLEMRTSVGRMGRCILWEWVLGKLDCCCKVWCSPVGDNY